MNRLIIFLLCLGFAGSLSAQKEDPVLFTVAGMPVKVSEFEYIYAKTNGKEATFSKESLQEYLDLYVKFKLKVKRALDLKLDTVPQLIEELKGYRKQLADSYLINKEVTEKLVREVYQRAQQDVDISHILFALPANASPTDTLAAFRKAVEAKRTLDAGEESFGNLAARISDDKSAPRNNGRIGYLNVLFPNGFYDLETAAYTMPLKKISNPIRTPAGYHLVMVNNRRPARGEIEVAHILLRKEGKDPAQVEAAIRNLYEQLNGGARFEDLCRTASEDIKTSGNGGYLGFVGINQVEQAFEEAAFAIPTDGAYAAPVETSIGWHIIKRVSLRGMQSYDLVRPQLEMKVKRDARFELARTAMIATIKNANGFKETRKPLLQFAETANDTFFTFRWKASETDAREVLFTLGEQKVLLGDFFSYLTENARERMRLRDSNPKEAVLSLYDLFVDTRCMQFEERQLESKYPDFKALMREYEEGILLFEATRIEVWDKAAQDTTGIQEYFATIPGKYVWNDRAEVTKYMISPPDMIHVEPARAFAAQNDKEATLEKFNNAGKRVVNAESFMIEREKSPESTELRQWKAGEVSPPNVDRERDFFYFLKVEKVIPSTPKALSEARGYVVADYQDFLEQKWVASLQEMYEVKVNRNVLDKLVRN